MVHIVLYRPYCIVSLPRYLKRTLGNPIWHKWPVNIISSVFVQNVPYSVLLWTCKIRFPNFNQCSVLTSKGLQVTLIGIDGQLPSSALLLYRTCPVLWTQWVKNVIIFQESLLRGSSLSHGFSNLIVDFFLSFFSTTTSTFSRLEILCAASFAETNSHYFTCKKI